MSTTKLKVVNLFGAPGVGKSAARSGLFWLMKIKDMSVEEVSEFAKYLVLAKRQWQLSEDQLYILAKQHHKMLILKGAYEFAVTDSPLLLAGFYCEETRAAVVASGKSPTTPAGFVQLCVDYASGFDNLNIFLTHDFRQGSFEERGRVHGREDSIRIDREQKEFLTKCGQDWVEIPREPATPWTLIEAIERRWPGSVPSHGPMRPQIAPKSTESGQ